MTLDGFTIMRHGFMNEGPAALYTGPVEFRNGCVGAVAGTDATSGGLMPIVWPPTARLARETGELVLIVDDLIIHRGDVVSIGGGEYNDVAFIEQLSGRIPGA